MELRERNKLLYDRAGFGISLSDYDQPKPIENLTQSLFPKQAAAPLTVVTAAAWAENAPRKEMDPQERKEKRMEMRQLVGDLNLLWLNEMVQTAYPLLEKTSLFWHGHFACRIDNPYFQQDLLQNIRSNALGNFGDLLKAVSKSPAMLSFLNNQQNRKQHPNENFAREVMELFTLGRGHYSEDDVKEAARAFTGWGFDQSGGFVFRERAHDEGRKKFLGKEGNFNGDDILNILLAQKQTSVFITQKLYRYFVSDTRTDERRVNELAKYFYHENYDIGKLLEKMFTEDWFYDDQNIGAKIKSPVELIVGYMRTVPLRFTNEKTPLQLQRILGQLLFAPPNVAGWPGGKNWIDSSSLVIRMRLPEAFLGSKEINLQLKELDTDLAEASEKMEVHTQQFNLARANPDWDNYVNYWKQQAEQTLPKSLAAYLLPFQLPPEKLDVLKKFADKDSSEEYIKSLTILLMEMPEYQLC
ncbi:DUF1800 domain-containing protein [Taibaiella soli]|uniref:DUF1800 domain-containing protein n=1 Tax=Taibaiella soli TaxID=1649169 RepID=A0A2W2AGY9_9BACT|nr:DUF1800 domain-containing protein [Taibaiella soli]PZF71480.1 DUF1800 domain-containing protein [Taibaiella soli]